jgi:hypothetical protein
MSLFLNELNDTGMSLNSTPRLSDTDPMVNLLLIHRIQCNVTLNGR